MLRVYGGVGRDGKNLRVRQSGGRRKTVVSLNEPVSKSPVADGTSMYDTTLSKARGGGNSTVRAVWRASLATPPELLA